VNEALNSAFRLMHEEIAKKGFDDGCAALVVYLTHDRIWLANAGDSRAIMCRKGRAVQIRYSTVFIVLSFLTFV
jgi:serine/threonine protein phosphatase PrpC